MFLYACTLSLDVYKMLDQNEIEGFNHLIQTAPQLLNSLRDSDHSSLLMKAAIDGNRNAFSKLLEYPQDLSIVDCYGRHVFCDVAAFRNDEWWFHELKESIDDPNELKELLNKKNNSGSTPLHCAARHNCCHSIEWLLLNGADVNVTDNDGIPADEDDRCNAKTKRLIREHREKK